VSVRQRLGRAQSRRRGLSLALGLATFAAISAAPLGATATASPPNSSALDPSPWQQADGSAALSRSNLTETILTRDTVMNAALLYSLPTPTTGINCGARAAVTSPVLKAGRIYDIANGRISMYSARTGNLRWRVTPDSTFATTLLSLSVERGLVVVGEVDCLSHSDPSGVIEAYDTTTGHLVWSTVPAPGAPCLLTSTCVNVGPLTELVDSGPYLVQTGASAGSGEVTSVYKVSTGEQIWTQRAFAASCGPAIVVHGLVIHTICDGDTATAPLEADSLSTGHKVWARAGTWQIIRGSEQGLDGHVYVTRTQNLDGENVTSPPKDLDATTGATRFQLTGTTNILAVDNYHVYAKCGAAKVCGYNETTGTSQWQFADRSRLASEAGGALYLADGKVLKTSNGHFLTQLWQATATDIAIGDGRAAAVWSADSDTTPATLSLYGLAGICGSVASGPPAAGQALLRCHNSQSPGHDNCCTS